MTFDVFFLRVISPIDCPFPLNRCLSRDDIRHLSKRQLSSILDMARDIPYWNASFRYGESSRFTLASI
jgi:hypothetical protein